MADPDITILIPTFNRRKFLPLLLRNIYVQDYPHDKIKVIIDDDGQDKLFIPSELEEIKKELSPIDFIYYNDKPKRSIGKKRNDLIKECKTKIFAFMDDDDIYLPTYLSHSYSTLKKNNVGCVGSDKMIFCMTDKEFGLYAINCGDNIEMIHEATIMATKKWFKGSCKFNDGSTGEGRNLFVGQKNKVHITDIEKVMVCVQHSENTINKDHFQDDKFKIDMQIDSKMIDLLKVVLNYENI